MKTIISLAALVITAYAFPAMGAEECKGIPKKVFIQDTRDGVTTIQIKMVCVPPK
jgi:hypothetical protein